MILGPQNPSCWMSRKSAPSTRILLPFLCPRALLWLLGVRSLPSDPIGQRLSHDCVTAQDAGKHSPWQAGVNAAQPVGVFTKEKESLTPGDQQLLSTGLRTVCPVSAAGHHSGTWMSQFPWPSRGTTADEHPGLSRCGAHTTIVGW